MKALYYDSYTTVDGLKVGDIPAPPLDPARVMIRVEAASLNAWDWHMYRGQPLFMRASEGLTVKGRRVVCSDVAGTVTEVGDEALGLAVGDRVFGTIGARGAAEFAISKPGALAVIPERVSFADAAASGMAGLTALQGLRDAGGLAVGERVLVWGASGGVGHFAVQMARALGASRVDAVCSGRNAEMVRGIGADAVYDYTDPGAFPEGPYDVVFDLTVTVPMSRLKTVLAPGARVVVVGSNDKGKWLGAAKGILRRVFGGMTHRVAVKQVLANGDSADLEVIAGWLASGAVKPVIQQVYALEDGVEACRVLEGGHVAGKLVIRVGEGE